MKSFSSLPPSDGEHNRRRRRHKSGEEERGPTDQTAEVGRKREGSTIRKHMGSFAKGVVGRE